MYAKNANISGTIYATAGTIGGCSISNGRLTVPSGYISGTFSANKISGGKLNMTSNGGGYLRIGEETTHPDVSGLNMTGNGGMALHGNGISGLGTINTVNGNTGQSGVVKIAYGFEWTVRASVLTGVSYYTAELTFDNGVYVGKGNVQHKEVAI